MIPRNATATLLQQARGFPVLALTGPRQSGKTTLARSAFPRLPYVNLEDPDTRELALADPRRFLARLGGGAILDEVQRSPGLLSYLLGVADAAPAMGRWVLTGSQQFGLMDGIAQSLTGRAAMLTLLPLAHSELVAAAGGDVTLEERLWRGGYPALHARHRRPDPTHWFSAYVATYLERDVRQLLNVGNLLTFQRFLAMCAARSGQLLNLNSLASDCGISQPTARQWLTVLQASHLLTLVPPYHRNFGKRLVKAPKLYFLDSGLLCHLLRIATPADLQVHAWNNIGRLLEQMRHYPEAEAALKQSLLLEPAQPSVIQHYVHLRQKQCAWPVYQPVGEVGANRLLQGTSLLAMMGLSDDPALP